MHVHWTAAVSEYVMWRFKENEDRYMAAAGFIFLSSELSKEKKQEAFLGEANIE